MTALWHYTCQHGADHLGEQGTLLPIAGQSTRLAAGRLLSDEAAPLLLMVWATDMDPPERRALGLTSDTYLTCDRMAYRYRVPADLFARWGRIRSSLPTVLVDGLELAPGAEPAHWWVSLWPVPGAHRDKEWAGA